MPKRSWASHEQSEFLYSHLPKYLEAQPKKDYNSFWSRLFEDWFAEWPERRVLFPNKSVLTIEEEVALGSAQKERREKLQTWYRYRTSGTRSKRAASVTKRITALQTRTRLPQKQELYSQMYKELIKPVFTGALKAENATTPAEKLAVIKRVQKEAYMNASDDVKQEVENALAQKVLAKASLKEKSTPRTAREYQDAIDTCPSVLRQIMESLAECTGWSFTILMGGPEPKNNGEIACWSFHYGENMLGNSFGDAHPSFEQSYMGPYNEFLDHVYPDSVRQSRSLAENKREGIIEDQSKNKSQDERLHDNNPEQSDDTSAAKNTSVAVSSSASMTSLNGTSSPLHSDGPRDSAKSALPFDASSPPTQATPDLGHLPTNENELESAKSALPFDAESSPPAQATPDLGHLPTKENEFGVIQNVNNYTFIHGPENTPSSSDASMTSLDRSSPLRSDEPQDSAKAASPFDTSSPPAQAASDLGQLPTHDSENGFSVTRNVVNSYTFIDGPNTAGLDMGVDLDPFGSVTMTNNNNHQTDWQDWDMFLAALDVSQLNGIDVGGTDTDTTFHSVRDTRTDKQGSPPPTNKTHIDGSEYAKTINYHSAVSAQATQWHVGDTPVASSGNPSPDAITQSLATPNDPKVSEGHSVQKLSKSGRAIIPSTRLDKMNKIGSNKENVSPATSVKLRNEWADSAKEYMSGLTLGEDWKGCIDAWLRVEEPLGSTGTLPTGDRPQEWKAWTSKGRNGSRPYNLMPFIKDPEEFGLACINWWNKIQPSFRYNEQGSMPISNFIPPDAEALEDVWEPLRKGGPNGLVIVLLLFSWWGLKLQQTIGYNMEITAQWRTAITDLRHTLEAMGATAQKRASPTDAVLQTRNKRQRR